MKIVSFHVKRRRKNRAQGKPAGSPRSVSSNVPDFARITTRLRKLFASVMRSKARLVALFGCMALLLALLPFTGPGQAVMAAAVKRDLPIYSVKKDSNVVSLTFDAAWGNEDTQQLIDILGKYNIKATFFVVGEWVDKYPESVKALFDAGHEIMNHSSKHDHYPKLSAEQIAVDLRACNDKIESVTGVRPTLFRPPYGDYSDMVVGAVRGEGMYTIQWDVDWCDVKVKSMRQQLTEVCTSVYYCQQSIIRRPFH